MNSSTPTNIHITPRNIELNFDNLDSNWLEDPFRRHFLYALSIFIPVSERAVCDVLREYVAHIEDPKLKQDVIGFIKQESRHGRMHQQCNKQLKGHYHGLGVIEWVHHCFINVVHRISNKKYRLAMPVAFEHFTGAISKEILFNQDNWISQPHNGPSQFVLWHCLEELEHQAVCLDVFKSQHTSCWPISLSLSLFWAPLSFVSIFGIYLFLLMQTKIMLNPVNWLKAFAFILRCSGLFWRRHFKYIKKAFQPWKRNEISLYKKALLKFNQGQRSQSNNEN